MNGDGRSERQETGISARSMDQWGATPRSSDASSGLTADPVVELRHEAGLTAGHSLGLRPGKFRLGPRRSSEGGLVSGAPEAVSFDLTIETDGKTTLSAGRETVAVEGVLVDRPVHLDDGDVIQLQTDHFVLRSLNPKTRRLTSSIVTPHTVLPPSLRSMSGWLWFFAAVALFGFILGFARSSMFGIMLIGLGGIVATLIFRSRRHRRAREEHATQLANARGLFFNELVDSRKAAAEALRSEANTPATVARRAAQPPKKTGSHLYATVASGDRSWEAPVVCHRDSGWDHQAVVDELSFLPAIPFTIDLDLGPIAVVGPRLATLAVTRHIATTAIVASPPNSGVMVETTVPADWRWLVARSAPTLRIFDGTTGLLGPRTVVIADSLEALSDAAAFTHIIQLDNGGRASIRRPTGDTGRDFAPHGITERQATQVLRTLNGPDTVIDLRSDLKADFDEPGHEVLDSNRLLVTGPDRSRTKAVLATAALRQAARHPDRSIFILDRGDRALIRLAQLEACHRYVAIDQITNAEYMLGELEALEREPSDTRLLFLAPDLWETTAFYRNSGRADLADRIDQIVARMELVPAAASAPDLERVPQSSFLVWVNTEGNDLAEVHVTDPAGTDAAENQVIDLDTLPGVDLTASVARLSASLDEETPS